MHSEWRMQAAELRMGWPVLVGALLGVAVGNAALPFYTAGVFVGAFESQFGWTRSQLAAAAFAGTLTIVACAPIVGAIIDRFGVRGPAAVSFACVASAFYAVSLLDGQFVWYVGIQIAGAALGLASTPVAFTRAVNERFDRSRGLALGVTLAGTGIAAALGPPLVAYVVNDFGWRAGMRALSLIVIVVAPIVIVLLSLQRTRPSGRAASTIPTAELSLSQAWRRPVFLRLVCAFALLALGVCGYVMHLIPMLTDQGIEIATAAALQSNLGIAVIVGRIAVGALVDRYFAPYVAAVMVLATALALTALAVMGPTVAGPAAFAIGFALGAEVDLIGYLTARYFGLASYGRLYGVLYGAFVLGTGLSPLMIARLQANSGNYESALWTCAGLIAVAALLFATSPRFPGEAAPAQERAETDDRTPQIERAS